MTRLPVQRRTRPVTLTARASTPRRNFFARPQPGCTDLPTGRITAWLDNTDRVICLPTDWPALAHIMGSPELERDNVLGRPVSWFIADETVRECFRGIFERARHEGRAARLLARCDSADEARAMQLRLVPMSAGAIECTWAFLRGAAAEELPLVRRRLFREGEHLRMCSWCRQVHLDTGWQRLEAAAPALGLLDHDALPRITHGICTQCSAMMAEEDSRLERCRVAV